MVVLMPLLAAALVVRRMYFIVAPGRSRGTARCASQLLDRGAHADARDAMHVLDCCVQAVARGAALCALHVHGRGARTDACGRSFAVMSTLDSAVGVRLCLVVPRPFPGAVASRCCRRSF